jgi:hypothetical protein
MNTLITEQQALTFLNGVSGETLTALDPFVLNALNTELLNSLQFNPLEEDSNREDVILYVDGEGTDTVWCPILPIVSMTSIKIMFLDGTFTDLTMGSQYPQVTYDPINGSIKRVGATGTSNGSNFESLNGDDGCIFPKRKNSVKLTGVFGVSGQIELLQYILQLKLLKYYSLKSPGVYAVDLAEEKIGNYSYKLRASGLSAGNQILTLDSYIIQLMNTLPKDTSNFIGSI